MISHANIFSRPFSANPDADLKDPYDMIFYLRIDKFKLQCEIDRLNFELDMYKTIEHNKKIIDEWSR